MSKPDTQRDTKPTPREADPVVDQLPPFRVLLHNDNQHDMLYVVESLIEATPLAYKVAARVMLEAHMRGASLVMTTHKERAEFYRDRIRAKGLTASIQPASE